MFPDGSRRRPGWRRHIRVFSFVFKRLIERYLVSIPIRQTTLSKVQSAEEKALK